MLNPCYAPLVRKRWSRSSLRGVWQVTVGIANTDGISFKLLRSIVASSPEGMPAYSTWMPCLSNMKTKWRRFWWYAVKMTQIIIDSLPIGIGIPLQSETLKYLYLLFEDANVLPLSSMFYCIRFHSDIRWRFFSFSDRIRVQHRGKWVSRFVRLLSHWFDRFPGASLPYLPSHKTHRVQLNHGRIWRMICIVFICSPHRIASSSPYYLKTISAIIRFMT